MSEAMLTVEEVMQSLGLSRHQVYRRIASGVLPASTHHLGKLRYLVSESAVEHYRQTCDDPRPMPVNDRMRVSDVAAKLGFGTETVRRMIQRGELDAVRGTGARGHYRISRASVDAYLANNPHR